MTTRRVFTIRNWHHDPARRKHRWRCQACSRIIEDGADVVVERRGRSSHGYHADCFVDAAAGPLDSGAKSVLARADMTLEEV